MWVNLLTLRGWLRTNDIYKGPFIIILSRHSMVSGGQKRCPQSRRQHSLEFSPYRAWSTESLADHKQDLVQVVSGKECLLRQNSSYLLLLSWWATIVLLCWDPLRPSRKLEPTGLSRYYIDPFITYWLLRIWYNSWEGANPYPGTLRLGKWGSRLIRQWYDLHNWLRISLSPECPNTSGNDLSHAIAVFSAVLDVPLVFWPSVVAAIT